YFAITNQLWENKSQHVGGRPVGRAQLDISFYAEFVVHLVLKRKVESRRHAQGIGNLSYLSIHFKKFLNLFLRNDAARGEGVKDSRATGRSTFKTLAMTSLAPLCVSK